MIAPRELDGALAGLSSGIAEKHPFGEGQPRQLFSKLLLALNPVKIGRVPEFLGLRLECCDEAGMSMAEGVDGDTGAEIEVSLAGLVDEPAALAAYEDDVLTGVGAHHRGRSRAQI